MALEAVLSNDFYDSIISAAAASQHYSHEIDIPSSSSLFSNVEISAKNSNFDSLMRSQFDDLHGSLLQTSTSTTTTTTPNTSNSSFISRKPSEGTKTSKKQGSKKRRRRSRVCKSKEEAETQRMTHITVERNRRRQMNDYLAVLRSLMPESYSQRLKGTCLYPAAPPCKRPKYFSSEFKQVPQAMGDQASIVGGAIEFVKELEQLLQSLEAQKHLLQQQQQQETHNSSSTATTFFPATTPFTQFFASPQFSSCRNPADQSENRSSIADIEVTLIETHANIRILTQRRPRLLFKIVTKFQTFQLTILHLNVTTLDPFVLYCFSIKVEEGCHLSSVDDISCAVHHMLRLIEDEETALAS